MSENYLNSLYYKTKNEWLKEQEVSPTSMHRELQSQKKKKKRRKKRNQLDILDQQIDDYIDCNYNRQIYKEQLKENSLYQTTSKIKKQQKVYKYKDYMFQMQNNLDMIDKVVESVLEYNNRQNELSNQHTFLHYLSQMHKNQQQQQQQYNNSQYNYNDSFNNYNQNSSSSFMLDSSQNSSRLLQKQKQQQQELDKKKLDPRQQQLERYRIREIELKRYEEEQKLKKYSSLIERHKRQVNQMYDEYQTKQFRQYDDEIKRIEQEKLRKQQELLRQQQEWDRKKNLKKKVMNKIKIVFLTIQLFKKSARDYKVQVRQMRQEYDQQQQDIINKYLKPCLNDVSIGFIKNILEQYESQNIKYFILTNDKFFLNDYELEPIKPKKLIRNFEFVLNTFNKFIKDFQDIITSNDKILSNLQQFFQHTFSKNQFVLRNFFSKEFLNRLKLTNYGQLKQVDQVIYRNVIIFVLINKIMIPIVIKAVEHQNQNIGSRMVCKVIVSVLYYSQEFCQEENLKQQENNQAYLSHEYQIQPLNDQIIDKKLKQNLKQKNDYFQDILVIKKIQNFFSKENKNHMNERINNLALKVQNLLQNNID